MNAILYCRVSSDDQVKNFSIDNQIEMMSDYVHRQAETIFKIIEDDGYSAKTFNRPGWKNLTELAYKYRQEVDKVYILRWDRFGRNTEFCLRTIREFREKGIEINSTQQPIDFDSPHSKFLLHMYLTAGEVENDTIGIRTREGINKSLREGFWPNFAPLGYKNIKIDGRGTLAPSDQAPVISYIFNEFSRGIYTQNELRVMVRRKFGKHIPESTMSDILRRIVYTGRVYAPEFGNKPAAVVQAIHEPIVDLQTFNQVQDLLDGKKRANPMQKDSQDRLPLRGHLVCPECGKKLTGSASKSRNGSRHHYYHCRTPCKVRFSVTDTHDHFHRYLRSLSPPPEHLDLFKTILEEELILQRSDVDSELKKAEQEISEIREKIASAEIRVFNGELASDLFDKVRGQYKLKIDELEARVSNLSDFKYLDAQWIDASVDFIGRLDYWFSQATTEIKREILGSTFPEKIIFDGKKCRTTKLNSLIAFLSDANRDFDAEFKQKEPSILESSGSVPSTGQLSNQLARDLKVIYDLVLRIQAA